MKYWFLLLLVVVCSFSFTYSKPISQETAQKVVKNFLLTHNQDDYNNYRILEKKGKLYNYIQSSDTLNELIYIFEKSEGGFLIVSGDDAVQPILAYSLENKIDVNNIPPQVNYFLEIYVQEIENIRKNNLQSSYEVQKQWEQLLNYNKKNNELKIQEDNLNSVQPLTEAKWNQAPFYNDFCPIDSKTQQRAVAGCVAIAMGQVMKYWQYPDKGVGTHSYYTINFSWIEAGFDDYTINWDNIPNSINSSNEDLAYFIYLIGVSVDMQYGVSSSGAYVFSDTNNSYYCAQSSLNKIWKYDKSIKGIFREGKADVEWINLIKKEILAGKPVIYAGYGKDGGHAWVCDGFDENNLFSMNWGWGGLYNGFYNINSLNPGSSGIGSGSGSFNSGQGILINIKPSIDNSSIITITGNLDFGKVNIGQSKEQIFYINNIGSKSFFVNTITSDSQYFICDSIVNTTVNPGEQIQIKLKFQPQNIFYQTGHIKINADANFGVSKIKVTGKGSNPNSIDESYDNNISAILFPNPTSEYLSINTQNINKNTYLEIFDIYGNCLMKQIIQPNETLQKISLSELNPGVYFVKIGHDKLIKFIKI